MIKLPFETHYLINLSHYRNVLLYRIEHPEVLIRANKSVSPKTKELCDTAFALFLATYDEE